MIWEIDTDGHIAIPGTVNLVMSIERSARCDVRILDFALGVSILVGLAKKDAP